MHQVNAFHDKGKPATLATLKHTRIKPHAATSDRKQADLQEHTTAGNRHQAAQVTGNKQTENKAAVARQRRSTIEQASVTNKSESC